MESRVRRFRNNQPAVFGGLAFVATLRLRLQAHGCQPLLNPEIKHVLSILALASLTLLTACFEEADGAVSYLAVNHTDRSIVSITVNDEGGILNSPPQGGGGGGMCCATLPSKWRPGLKVTIGWENDGDWLLDARGEEVIRDGKRVYVPLPWKTRTVDVPEYKGEDARGQFHIHFFPGDEVKVLRTVKGAWRDPSYPYPYPEKKAPKPEQP